VITEEQMQIIAREAAAEAVKDTLLALGVDANNIHAAQQDFAHLRKQRVASEQVGEWTRRALVGAFISGLIAVFFTGLHHIKF
jgi:hypothetical protein